MPAKYGSSVNKAAILDVGADPAIRDIHGKSAQDLAMEWKHFQNTDAAPALEPERTHRAQAESSREAGRSCSNPETERATPLRLFAQTIRLDPEGTSRTTRWPIPFETEQTGRNRHGARTGGRAQARRGLARDRGGTGPCFQKYSRRRRTERAATMLCKATETVRAEAEAYRDLGTYGCGRLPWPPGNRGKPLIPNPDSTRPTMGW